MNMEKFAEVVALMPAFGAGSNIGIDNDGPNFLHWEAKKGYAEEAKPLLAFGIVPNGTTDRGCPLFI